MTTAMSDPREAVQLLRDGVSALLGCDLSRLDEVGLTTLLREVETETRRAAALDARLLVEVQARGVAGSHGWQRAADVLVNSLNVSSREAQARVRRADDIGPRAGLTGDPLQPICPLTADTLQRGAISVGHVDAIAKGLRTIDTIDEITVDDLAIAEKYLVETALHDSPAGVARAAEMLRYRLDQDGARPREDEIERRRAFRITKRPNGSGKLGGDLTPLLVAQFESMLNPLAAPRPATDEGPDPRTAAQRNHDAVGEMLSRLLRSGTLPDSGGVATTVLIHVPREEIMKAWQARYGKQLLPDGFLTATPGRIGHEPTYNGLLHDPAELPMVLGTTSGNAPMVVPPWVLDSCDTAFQAVVEGDYAGVLALGREHRAATPKQRRALIARDRGCCFPNCTRPAAWTEAHHILSWFRGGKTELINLCLVCRYHHRFFEVGGWEIVMIGGAPHWIPPAHIDPTRKPRRNTAHHPPDIEFPDAVLPTTPSG